jgi:hypothetical protein
MSNLTRRRFFALDFKSFASAAAATALFAGALLSLGASPATAKSNLGLTTSTPAVEANKDGAKFAVTGVAAGYTAKVQWLSPTSRKWLTVSTVTAGVAEVADVPAGFNSYRAATYKGSKLSRSSKSVVVTARALFAKGEPYGFVDRPIGYWVVYAGSSELQRAFPKALGCDYLNLGMKMQNYDNTAPSAKITVFSELTPPPSLSVSVANPTAQLLKVPLAGDATISVTTPGNFSWGAHVDMGIDAHCAVNPWG